jgi:chaperonin GroES
MTNIEPLGGLVLLEELQQEDRTTASGLVLTAVTLDSELNRGKIVAVGPGERDQEGKVHSVPLQVGQIVFYNGGNATEVKDSQNKTYQFVNWRNLFGVENNG